MTEAIRISNITITPVAFADPPVGSGETRLSVRGPRLALAPDGRPMERWTTDDYIEPLGERAFRFHGRRGRLIKVNGRRISLDLVEERLRAAVPCADLLCLPVTDRLRGEGIELLVAAPADPSALDRRTAGCLRELGVTVRRISVVDAIERSAVGKPRQLSPHSPDRTVTP